MVRSSQTQTQPSVTLERAGPQKETARVSNARPGYRTLNNATVRMAELARDSIFRQIALRMNGEGGEMKILLDPPELGQLDLHMVVEKGGRVHLSLIAERPELALLLEKHLGELKQTLQSHGLSIGNTEVRGRGERPRNREHSQDFAFPEGPLDDGQDWSTAAFQRAGYITAEGLDFWV